MNMRKINAIFLGVVAVAILIDPILLIMVAAVWTGATIIFFLDHRDSTKKG
jgi:hypothetical protein